MGIRRSTALAALALTLVFGAVAYEAARPKPPAADPVASRRPLRDDEAARLEGGFVSRQIEGSRTIFELAAQSELVLDGGAHFLREVSELKFYLEDGRPVTLRADRGLLQRGVTQESDDVTISLEGEVTIVDPDGSTLVTDELNYDASRSLLVSPGPARIRRAGMEARVESFTYHPDSRVVETSGGLELILAGNGLPWRIESSKASYRLGSGEIVLPLPFRARQPDRTIVAADAVIHPASDDAEATTIRGTGPMMLSGIGDLPWQLAAGSFEGTARARGPFDELSLSNGTSIGLRSAGGAGRSGRGALSATRWQIRPGPDGRGLVARADRGFRARWTPSTRAQSWDAEGEVLTIRQDHQGSVSEIRGERSVSLHGGDGISVRGDSLFWSAGEPDIALVRGRAAQAQRQGYLIEAPLLRFDRVRRVLVGEEGAITELPRVSANERALFRGEEPVRVRSNRVRVSESGGEVVFEGPVQAWQGDTTLRGARMRYREDLELLVAEEDVVGRFVVGTGADQRPIRLATARLEYRSQEGRALLSSGASFQDRDFSVSARSMQFTLSEKGDVDRMTAEGAVTLERGADRGSADRLEWTGGAEGMVELIGEENLARLLPSTQGKEVLATRIRYYPSTRTFSTEGAGGRTVVGEAERAPNEQEKPPDE